MNSYMGQSEARILLAELEIALEKADLAIAMDAENILEQYGYLLSDDRMTCYECETWADECSGHWRE